MTPDLSVRMTYDEWRELLNQELGVHVVDDEGRRRLERGRQLGHTLTRSQAEAFYTLNAFVRIRAEGPGAP